MSSSAHLGEARLCKGCARHIILCALASFYLLDRPIWMTAPDPTALVPCAHGEAVKGEAFEPNACASLCLGLQCLVPISQACVSQLLRSTGEMSDNHAHMPFELRRVSACLPSVLKHWSVQFRVGRSCLDWHIRANRYAREQVAIAWGDRDHGGMRGLADRLHDLQGRLLHRRPDHSMALCRLQRGYELPVRWTPEFIGWTLFEDPLCLLATICCREAGASGCVAKKLMLRRSGSGRTHCPEESMLPALPTATFSPWRLAGTLFQAAGVHLGCGRGIQHVVFLLCRALGTSVDMFAAALAPY